MWFDIQELSQPIASIIMFTLIAMACRRNNIMELLKPTTYFIDQTRVNNFQWHCLEIHTFSCEEIHFKVSSKKWVHTPTPHPPHPHIHPPTHPPPPHPPPPTPTHHWPWSQSVLIVLRYCAKSASPKDPITMDTDIGRIDATGVGDHHSHINPAFEGDGPHHICHIYEEILDLPVDSPDVLQHEGISTIATDGSLVQDEGMGSARFSLYLTSSPQYVYSICTWIFNTCHNRYIP